MKMCQHPEKEVLRGKIEIITFLVRNLIVIHSVSFPVSLHWSNDIMFSVLFIHFGECKIIIADGYNFQNYKIMTQDIRKQTYS